MKWDRYGITESQYHCRALIGLVVFEVTFILLSAAVLAVIGGLIGWMLMGLVAFFAMLIFPGIPQAFQNWRKAKP